MSKETGGPAFPDHEGQYDYTGGMTLRDFFAAKAMQALLTGRRVDTGILSKEAFAVADAMLEARLE